LDHKETEEIVPNSKASNMWLSYVRLRVKERQNARYAIQKAQILYTALGGRFAQPNTRVNKHNESVC
jgi:hypothetical protein